MLRVLLIAALVSPVFGADFRGRQFIALGPVRTGEDGIFMSELIKPALTNWDELVVSWNSRDRTNGLQVEVQAISAERETKWYHLGKWSAATNHPRESVNGQRDEHGKVDTDTLKLKQPGGAVRVRITTTAPKLAVDFLGLSFADSEAELAPLEPNRKAWGKIIPVEERSQADYPEGIKEWCSPTALSMLLNFWSKKLERPELNHSVPDTARAVNDPNWPGTGNWPFNTAFAGMHPGIRSYVARFSDVSELEDWIEADIPVAFSVSYSLLKGSAERGNGHLLVCVGFTESGDIVTNDPGRRQVRQIYSRENLIKGWAESENTVYLVYPEGAATPRDRFGHWDSRVHGRPGSGAGD